MTHDPALTHDPNHLNNDLNHPNNHNLGNPEGLDARADPKGYRAAGLLGGCPGQRPFKCSYCPYSASQKGNLKTHVLCVHRMPFDNSQYPDRRFKRSRPESDVPEKNMDDVVGGITSNQPMAVADGSHRGNSGSNVSEIAYCYRE
ncbi:hypothetical protein PAMA_000103 [Pampus argenteus]